MSKLLVINHIIRQNIYFGEYVILIKQKMASLKIKYRHSSIEGKAGTLFYQVIHNRVARQINSGYKIYPDEWDIFNSQIIIPAKTGENRHRYLVSLKKCIKEDTSRLKDIMIRFENLGYKYTTDEIIEYNLFEERLEKNDLLPLGESGDHLLVETSYFSPPMGLNNILLRIKAKGYYPILAHPERYVYMGESDYRQLKDMGVKLQLNLPSIVGMYGDLVKKKAMLLLNEKVITHIGTDIHNYKIFQKFICTGITKNVQKLLDFNV